MQHLAAVAGTITGVAESRSGPPPIRQPRRATTWREAIDRIAAWRLANSSSEAERDQIEAELAAELAAGPGFLKVWRGSGDEMPVACRDRNALARLMAFFARLERESYKADRAWADHEGRRLRRTIALTVARVLLAIVSLAKKHEHVFPSLERLARMAQVSVRTVASALTVLAALGLVRRYRRRKTIRTSFGPRVVQDTSAYEVIVPADLETARPAPPEKRAKSTAPVQTAKVSKQLITPEVKGLPGWIGPAMPRPNVGDWRAREREAMAVRRG